MSDPSGPIGPSTVVVVSGGSRGLGLAIVDDILAQGAKVAAFARSVTPELAAAGRRPTLTRCTSAPSTPPTRRR